MRMNCKPNRSQTHDNPRYRKHKWQLSGFALIVTISLMVVLSLLGVGLLALSSLSLRTAAQSEAMSRARANARLALMMAIGDLQKKAGPDQRATAPANLVDSSMPMGLTGVWRGWRPDPMGARESDYLEHKGPDHFLGYLVSDPTGQATPDPSRIPSGDSMVTLLGGGTLGPSMADDEVEAELIPLAEKDDGNASGCLAWAILEENTKARMDLLPTDRQAPVTLAE